MGKSSTYYLGKRPDIIKLLPNCYTKVLEIGCGDGGFSKNLKQTCEYWGIEPVQNVAKSATKSLHKALIGTYQEVHEHLPNNYFDLVICNDVIEHMEDHDQFFEMIKQKMRPDSHIVGSIPNVRYFANLYALLLKRDWMYKDKGILDRTHLRFFTEKSLKRTILEHGFVIEEFQGINSAIMRLRSIKRIIRYVIIRFIEFGSLGLYSDIKFLRFAFRIRYKSFALPDAQS
jgi:2-polyprenyl-3-methyl-5-hydroxy-6-metoxy-1,4-benzoquinol methylase